MYDVLPASWSRGAPARKFTNCCRGLGLEPPTQRCTICSGILVAKCCPSTKMYDLLPVRWSRSTRMHDFLIVSWSRIGAPALRCSICCPCLGQVVRQLLNVLFVAGFEYTICCRCLGLEVVPQHLDVLFVVGVLVSKLCPSIQMYDVLPVSWPRSGAPARGCTTC